MQQVYRQMAGMSSVLVPLHKYCGFKGRKQDHSLYYNNMDLVFYPKRVNYVAVAPVFAIKVKMELKRRG